MRQPLADARCLRCVWAKRKNPWLRGKSGVLLESNLAVRKGFEPLIRFLVYTLSRRAPSTARTPHRIDGGSCPSRRANVIERTAFGKNFFSLFMRLTNPLHAGGGFAWMRSTLSPAIRACDRRRGGCNAIKWRRRQAGRLYVPFAAMDGKRVTGRSVAALYLGRSAG